MITDNELKGFDIKVYIEKAKETITKIVKESPEMKIDITGFEQDVIVEDFEEQVLKTTTLLTVEYRENENDIIVTTFYGDYALDELEEKADIIVLAQNLINAKFSQIEIIETQTINIRMAQPKNSPLNKESFTKEITNSMEEFHKSNDTPFRFNDYTCESKKETKINIIEL